MKREFRFHAKLIEALRNFDLEDAEALSDEIHEAECSGYDVARIEDELWECLTVKIQKYYDKHPELPRS